MTHQMSDHEFYGWLIGWSLFALFLIGWIIWQVRESDRKHEIEEARQIEKDAEWDEWVSTLPERQKSAVYDLPRNQEQGFQERARKAESLGFRDDDPPRVA